jgi:hypothetical protein
MILLDVLWGVYNVEGDNTDVLGLKTITRKYLIL